MDENYTGWLAQDLQHTWHPCTQMKDHEQHPPLPVVAAKGAMIQLADGRELIDATSSWWCKTLGHGHPALKAALLEQINRFEHVIFADTSNETVARLSAKLATLNPKLTHVSYASDGASAVEIAMKQSLQYRYNRGEQRHRFIALKNGFHGETALTMSVGDVGQFKDCYQPILHQIEYISPVPYVNSRRDALWQDCSRAWLKIEPWLNQLEDDCTAILFEPVLQNVCGMRVYSQDLLRRLRKWSQERGIHLIADEIMTGIGRTGTPLACDHANITPDFICLGKGLTSGWLPLSAVVTTDAIYHSFYDDYDKGKTFMHSHTYSGNPLAASVALACLEVMDAENIYATVRVREDKMLAMLQTVADDTGRLENVRGIGAVVAADIKNPVHAREGYAVYRRAVEMGALLRPLGNTIYWLPPLNIEDEVLAELQRITQLALT